MMNARSLVLLKEFILAPSYLTGSRLIHIPSIYHTIQYELQTHLKILPKTLKICKWLYMRGESVRRQLIVHPTAESSAEIAQNNTDWQQVRE